jgi:hypothetical protein
MRRGLFFSLFAATFLAGCSDGGPTRYRVSGEAKFNGNPIPYGEIVFTPDGSKQNSGAQGFAFIEDGKFDTSGTNGKGVGGGPMVIHVIGLDKAGGKPLCEYEYRVDLPRDDTKHNIEVPATAVPWKKGTNPEI